MSEVDLSGVTWRKSSRSSGNGACVEVAFVAGSTAARDSKNPAGGALVFTPRAWSAFVGTVDAARR
ncbi:DUF397 domain-containing protein [Actinosynnema sp. NPDC050436]|uniref:DUF397 domain-containing protein n=1 Tax=Actinosynnema sp. NPDC050436 TaxID=3155659 RepID=UPI0033CE6479